MSAICSQVVEQKSNPTTLVTTVSTAGLKPRTAAVDSHRVTNSKHAAPNGVHRAQTQAETTINGHTQQQLTMNAVSPTVPLIERIRMKRRQHINLTEMDDHPIRKRIAVIGGHGVGKTALCRRCTRGTFEGGYSPTFEDMYRWRERIDGKYFDISILDTGGIDEYSMLGLHYTIGVDGYILVFSLRDLSTLHIIQLINSKLLHTLNALKHKGTSEIPRILVGNHCDDAVNPNVAAQAKQFAANYDIPYVETSACTGHNVPHIFMSIIRIIQFNIHAQHQKQIRHEDKDEDDTS